MRQKMKLRGFGFLLLVYTSLEAFRHIGWMLFYEQFVDSTRQEINFGFILYSGVIAITGMLLPLIFHRVRILDKIRSYPFVVGTLACIALLFRMIQLTMGITGAYIFLVLWTVTVMIGICICFARIFDTIPKALIGRFFGIAYFADALIVSFVELFTGTKNYFYASIIVGIVLCIIAGVSYIQYLKNTEMNAIIESEWKPSKRFFRIACIILVLYVLIAGMMDNLYFFDDWLELPYVGLFTLPMMSIMYLLGGFLFDKINLRIILPLAMLFICIAQAMTYFVTGGVFAYSYSVFSNLGSTILQLVTVIIPIYYARMLKRNCYFSSFGEGLFYSGFCVTSILFVFMKQAAYRTVMGGILLVTVICLIFVIELLILHEKDKHKIALESQQQQMDALKQQVTLSSAETIEMLPIQEEALNICFTKREKELMPLIVSSLTAEEIAEQAHVSVSTVRFHIKNILGKSNAKTRRELTRMLSECKIQMDTCPEKSE
ncbi:MAG TPA: helix-turn-helix transcriptional regulator [Lachnospiraceae bacterium]|nr:helix-turn-helix transcriptional regulator [Lachnospiraceae bacterium]